MELFQVLQVRILERKNIKESNMGYNTALRIGINIFIVYGIDFYIYPRFSS